MEMKVTNAQLLIFILLLLNFLLDLYYFFEKTSKKTVKIKYKDNVAHLVDLTKGDWIDLASPKSIVYKKGDLVQVDFGVAMELPSGYEAHLAPRSSLFQNTGLLLTNGVGVIDNSYCGDEDYWGAKFYATRDGLIEEGQRLCQFRIIENQPNIHFKEVKHLGNENRGGYGSTGK